MITKTTTNFQITRLGIDHGSTTELNQIPCEMTVTINAAGVPTSLFMNDEQAEALFKELFITYGEH
jgi:hypothetical protein